MNWYVFVTSNKVMISLSLSFLFVPIWIIGTRAQWGINGLFRRISCQHTAHPLSQCLMSIQLTERMKWQIHLLSTQTCTDVLFLIHIRVYDCGISYPICSTCKCRIGDNCTIFMYFLVLKCLLCRFNDHKFCSEQCRDEAVELCSARHFY